MSYIPLVSICIPTFNRSGLLANTLERIVCQDAFQHTQEIEVVVSDNGSEDDTKNIVSKYTCAYPGKVKYFPTKPIPGDENFERTLRLGSGLVRKLLNDSCQLVDGSLALFAKLVEVTRSYKPIIFFTNGNHFVDQDIVNCNDLNDFISHASYSSTWIGGFCIWGEHLDAIEDFSAYAEYHLAQTDVLLRLVAWRKQSLVFTKPFCVVQDLGRKSGYNIAEVFGSNYLRLLKRHVTSGQISTAIYEKEKKKVLVEHIIPFYFSNKHDFSRSGFFKHLEEYKNDDYFYEAIETLVFSRLSENKMTLR